MDRKTYQPLIFRLKKEIQSFYGDRLVTLALFGSYARNELRPDSDLDVLIIADPLPKGRRRRMAAFGKIEEKLAPLLERFYQRGFHPYFSLIFKNTEEASSFSPLFFDMTVHVEILYDRENFFRSILKRLEKRFKELGSKRIRVGRQWYWDLKPGLKAGEKFEI